MVEQTNEVHIRDALEGVVDVLYCLVEQLPESLLDVLSDVQDHIDAIRVRGDAAREDEG
ncbi:MAG: hypothetical protein M3Q03_01665 [Chloroflexota bacterium]|nr:hypothetical protein [Chloroflexota bacterium]